ncbi:hypothetical protein [Chamaesiphon sp.]|uniref:hypothetical protein n=1 Tax=Chamaesiphon sp. TaxID=2814140 RepID=UPI0035943203
MISTIGNISEDRYLNVSNTIVIGEFVGTAPLRWRYPVRHRQKLWASVTPYSATHK